MRHYVFLFPDFLFCCAHFASRAVARTLRLGRVVLLVVDSLFSCAHFVAGFARIQPVMLNSCESSYVWLRPQAASRLRELCVSKNKTDIVGFLPQIYAQSSWFVYAVIDSPVIVVGWNLATHSINSCGLNGFVTYSLQPAAVHIVRTSDETFPLTAIIGSLIPDSRNCRVAAIPSRIGMTMSISMMSNR